jgi:hypothetical protein
MTSSNAEMQRIEVSWTQLAELVNQAQDAERYTEHTGWIEALQR